MLPPASNNSFRREPVMHSNESSGRTSDPNGTFEQARQTTEGTTSYVQHQPRLIIFLYDEDLIKIPMSNPYSRKNRLGSTLSDVSFTVDQNIDDSIFKGNSYIEMKVKNSPFEDERKFNLFESISAVFSRQSSVEIEKAAKDVFNRYNSRSVTAVEQDDELLKASLSNISTKNEHLFSTKELLCEFEKHEFLLMLNNLSEQEIICGNILLKIKQNLEEEMDCASLLVKLKQASETRLDCANILLSIMQIT